MKPTHIVAFCAALLPSAAFACSDDGVLFFDAAPRTSILVLPDDQPLSDTAGITVTGAYTGTEQREGGGHLPVGFLLRDGEVINRNGARMDGVLLVEEGRATITRRDEIGIDSAGGRSEMAARAAEEGLSLLQSHLLIDEGELDLRAVDGAPRFTRRVLFETEEGLGLWQSAQPLTLHAAAVALQRACAPDMALNLDMGSYDYCVSDGRYCGLLRETERLSNLIRLERGERPEPDGDAENG
ncbi:hypothetical protein [Roseobacter sp. HKCCA0434]|uniref:hypothetical protein n=1 Tax=Roseobacter sp. HKCCA0434 TaxID=3079297 RepID=UPI0029058C36|nr:hypothetical protein [Roseobacter sp. HKCCA0434]